MDRSAFPSHGAMGEVVQEGMSLRAYIAAKAVAGICASRDEAGVLLSHGYDWIADEAIKIADAMLLALDMPGPQRENYELQVSNATARGDRMRDALRALQHVCANTNDGLEDDPTNREKYLEAMSMAEALLDDDENIPF